MALIHDYYRAPALSRSAIVELLKSPAHYQTWKNTFKTTSAMRVGTLLHYMVLDPVRLKSDVAIHTETQTLESVSGRKFMAANPTRFCCTKAEWDDARDLFHALKRNKDAWALLKLPARRERMVQVMINGVRCKALIDMSTRRFLLDLKTTTDPLVKFERSIEKYGLDVQAAWYSKIAEMVDGFPRKFIFLPIEKTDPYGCYPIEIEQDWIDYGWQKCLKAMEIYKQCSALDVWPGYEWGLRKMPMPHYLKERARNETDLPDVDTELEIERIPQQ
jgi:hypothetical protein